MTSLYDRFARSVDGARRLASARLRHESLRSLHVALDASGLNQTELANRLGIRKSAVSQVLHGDGNLRVKTLAEYLSAMGYELDLRLVEAGEPRKALVEERPVRPAFQEEHSKQDLSPAVQDQSDVRVVETQSHHVLMQVTVQSMGTGGASFQFTGSAHLVAKESGCEALLTADRFKPMSRREMSQ